MRATVDEEHQTTMMYFAADALAVMGVTIAARAGRYPRHADDGR